MAYKCPECGWTGKPSQQRYYQRLGKKRPVCSRCNPPRMRFFTRRALVVIFSRSYGPTVPLAAVPYVALGIVICALVTLLFPPSWHPFVIVIALLVYVLCVMRATSKVADRLLRCLIRREKMAKWVFYYYVPALIGFGALITFIMVVRTGG